MLNSGLKTTEIGSLSPSPLWGEGWGEGWLSVPHKIASTATAQTHTQGLNVNTSTRNAQLIITARLISDFGAFLNMVALATYVYLLSLIHI